jgi:hypothetical protein
MGVCTMACAEGPGGLINVSVGTLLCTINRLSKSTDWIYLTMDSMTASRAGEL